MKLYKEILLLLLFLLLTFVTFFYKVVFFKQVPFPGDLLVSTAPYKAQSYLGYAPGGYPNKGQGRDVIDQLYPWKFFGIQQEKQGQLPVWNPYNFSGNIALQNYQTGPFYPLNLLFFIFPFNFGWIIYVLLQPLLAFVFMYLFLRSLSLSKIPSAIGALAFAFSSYMVVWFEYGNIGHTFLWLPLILFAIQKVFASHKKILWYLLLFFAILFCFFAGYIQGTFYVLLVAGCFFLFKIFTQKENRKLAVTSFVFASFSSILIAFIIIYPTLDFFHYSTRGGYTFSQILQLLNPWYFLTTLFASDFFGNPATKNYFLSQTYFEHVLYVGIPILFFALYAITNVKNSLVTFFASIGGLFLILTTNIPGVAFLYLIPFPLISTTVPTRALSVFIFCAIVVAAIGIDYWVKKKEIKSYIPFIFAGVYVVLWIAVFLLYKFIPSLQSNLAISKHNLILPSALAVLTIGVFYIVKKYEKIAVVVLIVLVGLDAFYFFAKFTPFAPMDLMFPKNEAISFLQENSGIYRFWGVGNADVPANYQTVQNLYSPEGFDALHVKEYTELLETSGNGKSANAPSRTDANIAPSFGTDDFKDNQYRQTMLNLLGVKYILDLRDSNVTNFDYGTFDKDKYPLVWQNGALQIYENNQVFPRFFLTPQFVVKKSASDQIQAMYSEDLRHVLILPSEPSAKTDQTAQGVIQLNMYTPNKVQFSVNTTGNQFLFLSDTYYHDWIATIDNTQTPIYRADYAFRAVEVPQGTHKVTFEFVPSSLYTGAKIAIAGAVIFFAYFFFLIIKRK